MNNPYEILDDDLQERSRRDSEYVWFKSFVPDARITLQEKVNDANGYARFEPTLYPSTVSLLTCSSKYDYFVAGTLEGFIYAKTKILRSAARRLKKGTTQPLEDKIHVKIPQGPVHELRLNASQTQIIVTVAGCHVLIYNVLDVAQQKESVTPVISYQLESDILELRPNPEAFPDIAAVRLKGDVCKLIYLTSGEIKSTIPGDDVTAMGWSRKGKQIVCGRRNGYLQQYDTNAQQKDSLESPQEMRAGYDEEVVDRFVQGVFWIDNDIFLAIYTRPRTSSDDFHVHDAYIIDRKPKSGGGVQYIPLDEVAPVFSGDERQSSFYIESINHFSKEAKHVLIIANAASSDVSVVGQDENDTWATWILPETGLATLPLSEETNLDTYPVGIALDFTACEPLPPIQPEESDELVKPMPVFMYLNDEDHLGIYDCYNDALVKRGEGYARMKNALEVSPETMPVEAKPTGQSALGLSGLVAQQQGRSTSPGFGGIGQKATDITVSFKAPSFGAAQGTVGFSSMLQKKAEAPFSFSTSAFGAAVQKQSQAASSSFAALLEGAEEPNPQSATETVKMTSFGVPEASNTSRTSFRDLGATLKAPAFGQPATFGQREFKFGTTGFGGIETPKPAFEGASFASIAKQQAAKTTTSEPAKSIQDTQILSKPLEDEQTQTDRPSEASSPVSKSDAAPTPGTLESTPVSPSADNNNQETETGALLGKQTNESSTAKPEEQSQPATAPTLTNLLTSSEPLSLSLKTFESSLDLSSSAATTTATPSTTATAATSVPDTTQLGTPLNAEIQKAPESVKPPETAKSPEPKEVKQSVQTMNTQLNATPKFNQTTQIPSFGSFGQPSNISTSGNQTPTQSSTPVSLPPFASFASIGAAPVSTPISKPTFGWKVDTPSTLPAASPSAPSFSQTSFAEQRPGPTVGQSSFTASKPAVIKPTGSLATSSPAYPFASSFVPVEKPKTPKSVVEEFESTYSSINADLEKMDKLLQDLALDVQIQQKPYDPVPLLDSLNNDTKEWKLDDGPHIARLTKLLSKELIKEQPDLRHITDAAKRLKYCIARLKEKSRQIQQLIESQKDSEHEEKHHKDKDTIENDTLEIWDGVVKRSEASEKRLIDVENKVHDMKQEKESNSVQTPSATSLFLLHRALRELETEMAMKSNELSAFEERIACLRLKENLTKAAHLPSRIAVENDADNGHANLDQSDMRNKTKSTRNISHTHKEKFTSEMIKSTTKILRHERFLDLLCNTKLQAKTKAT